MLKVNKTEEPDFLKEFKRKNNPRNWDDYNNGIVKKEIKEHILLEEQNMYCPYCERVIDDIDDSHIEHIMPKDLHPNKFQDYDNLLTSCNDKLSCGNIKGNYYSDDFINPVIENPTEYLQYDIKTGEINPIHTNGLFYNKAKYTIDKLNLNNHKLVQARKTFLEQVDYMVEESKKEFLEYLIENQGTEGTDFIELIKLINEEYCI